MRHEVKAHLAGVFATGSKNEKQKQKKRGEGSEVRYPRNRFRQSGLDSTCQEATGRMWTSLCPALDSRATHDLLYPLCPQQELLPCLPFPVAQPRCSPLGKKPASAW